MLELLIIVGVLLMVGGLLVNFIQKRKGGPQ